MCFTNSIQNKIMHGNTRGPVVIVLNDHKLELQFCKQIHSFHNPCNALLCLRISIYVGKGCQVFLYSRFIQADNLRRS